MKMALGATLALCLWGAGCHNGPLNITVTAEYQTLQQTPHYARSVDLLLGAELKLVLYSNGTTGYLWTNPAQLTDPAVLEQTDHRYVIRPNPDPGEAGHEVFTFEATARGACTIYLEYKRPLSAEVAYTCTINVDVM
jgi:predicted secreted protein